MNSIFDFARALLLNFPLLVALLAMLIAQTIKIAYYFFKEGDLDIMHFFEAGGMPSAHSAMVTALTVSIGLFIGWGSSALAVALVVSLVVMYDAMGVRRAASKQANILNKLVEDFYGGAKADREKLKEIMGHSPLEVFAGAVLGILVALLFHVIFNIYAL